jgi:single-stranded-DNA-specific exonuclease
VADVAHQTADTRYLLQRGLDVLRTQPRVGLQAIYERADLNQAGLSEEHIGFAIAPRLNALGRLSDANPAVELMTTTDRGKARLLALQLEGLNARRQLLTSQILHGALAQLEQNRALLDEPAIVLASPSWEAGVIGIVASRLVELYSKPAVLISTSGGKLGRASARSVDGVDITKAIASQAGLLLGFGGHAMAAGFSLLPENIPAFQRGFYRALTAAENIVPLERPPLQIDAFVPWEQISLELAEEIERLSPFGPGNPPLTLASHDLHLVSHAALGREQEHLMLKIEDSSGLSRRVVWWGGAEYFEAGGLPQGAFDMAYRVRSRSFRGSQDLQLEFVDFRMLTGAPEVAQPAYEIDDYRLQQHPLRYLKTLIAQPPPGGLCVWAEGKAVESLAGLVPHAMLRTRGSLAGPLHTLVIWTAPPSAADLNSVLFETRPKSLVLVGLEPEEGSFQTFISRLAGLVRYLLARKGGETKLSHLAAGMAHREMCVLRGLDWLAAQGHLTFSLVEDNLQFSPGGQADPPAASILFDQLQALLAETRAYRSFFRRTKEPLN